VVDRSENFDRALLSVVSYDYANARLLLRGERIANLRNRLDQLVPSNLLAQVSIVILGAGYKWSIRCERQDDCCDVHTPSEQGDGRGGLRACPPRNEAVASELAQ